MEKLGENTDIRRRIILDIDPDDGQKTARFFENDKCVKTLSYEYVPQCVDDWQVKFFEDGLLPNDDLKKD
jgi:hypothetical protein